MPYWRSKPHEPRFELKATVASHSCKDVVTRDSPATVSGGMMFSFLRKAAERLSVPRCWRGERQHLSGVYSGSRVNSSIIIIIITDMNIGGLSRGQI